MKKHHFILSIPLILAFIFTLVDVFLVKFLTKHFIVNPQLVIMSYLELYTISTVTVLFIRKEQMLIHKHKTY